MAPALRARTGSPLEIGRMLVRKHTPYMYRLVYGLIPYPTEEVETLGVTPGLVMYYNPKYMATLEDLECGGVLLHEGLHPFSRHNERRGSRVHERWNRAGDIPINSTIRKTGLKIPLNCIFAETYNLPEGKTAEWYYERLPAQDAGKGRVAGGSCGGCAGHPGTNAELEQELDRKFGRSGADRERVMKQAAVDIRNHAQQHGRGSVPADLLDWAEITLTPPTVRWEAEFGGHLRTAFGQVEAGGQDYSLARPSKRSLVRGIIRPGLVDYQPEVAAILDTSGSMGGPRGKQIQAGLREMSGILRELGVEQMWFLEADAAVAMRPKRISIASLRQIEIRGGGGTDFGPAIYAAVRLQPKPDIIVYFTDLDGDCPKEPPDNTTVIWAAVPGRWTSKNPMPWGKTIWIKE